MRFTYTLTINDYCVHPCAPAEVAVSYWCHNNRLPRELHQIYPIKGYKSLILPLISTLVGVYFGNSPVSISKLYFLLDLIIYFFGL